MDDDQIAEAVRATCKQNGCMCKVDITIERPDPDLPNYIRAEAAHDSWCPLYAARAGVFN